MLNSVARTETAIIRSLAVIRGAQFVPYLPVLYFGDVLTEPNGLAIVSLYTLTFIWTTVMFFLALRRSAITGPWIAADLAVILIATYAVSSLSPQGLSLTWSNWTVGPMFGTAVVAMCFLGRLNASLALITMVMAYLAGTWRDLGVPGGLSSAIGNVSSMVAFAIAARLVANWLRQFALEGDALAQEKAIAQQEESASRARFEERTAQYRLLHDTVLSTLSMIARGGLDFREDAVKDRCAADADFIRGLISGSADNVPTSLGARLAVVGRGPSAFGLRVHQRFHGLPPHLDHTVVSALTLATREALNNVLKHAGVKEAWLTATGDTDGSVAISVVDHGGGFTSRAATDGTGIPESIIARVESVGGDATVTSNKDDGTCVDIRWMP